jgi:hypothetical protein
MLRKENTALTIKETVPPMRPVICIVQTEASKKPAGLNWRRRERQ